MEPVDSDLTVGLVLLHFEMGRLVPERARQVDVGLHNAGPFQVKT